MKGKRWKIRNRIVWMGVLFASLPCLSFAQPYPSKPISVLVGFVPGGSVDTSTRLLVGKAEKFVGQPFVISNNSGGGGSVALGIIAKEKPDGYRLAGTTSTGLVLIPQLRAVPYKLEDVVPIMHFLAMYTGLVVRSDSPWKTVKEFMEYSKMNPGKVTYGSPGSGTTAQIGMEYFGKTEGIQWIHVPYKGSAPALTSLLGGHVNAVASDTAWLPYVKAGSLRLLATHGEHRMKLLPDIPTFKELGYDFVNDNIFLMAAPKGTPPSIVKRLDEVFHRAVEDPEFVQAMGRMELEVTYGNSEDTRKRIEQISLRFKRIITELKIPKGT